MPLTKVRAGQISFKLGAVGAILRNLWLKVGEIKSFDDFGAVGDGITDDAASVQAGVSAESMIKFVSGKTYLIVGNISIPANTEIVVERGATVVCAGGRFTAYDVDNVHWRIDGRVQSTGMLAAPAKAGWPAIANGYFGDERGFIEFGGSSTTSPRSGFRVTGTGLVNGDWTGTPAPATSLDVNIKGIAVFNAKNVLVTIPEVYGFVGEAVYFWGVSANCVNVKFLGIYSHDHKFNALNFNVVGPERGLVIKDCITKNCYSGIESSAGRILDNEVYDPSSNGIWTGVGAGSAIEICRNKVVGAGAVGIFAGWSPAMLLGTTITNNVVVDSGTFGILATFCRGINVLSNVVRNHGRTGAGYAIQVSDSDYGQVAGNTAMFPGTHSSGDVFTSFNTTNLLVGENSVVSSATALNIDREYSEGTFVPVPSNLTIAGVGTVAYAGSYTKIGRVVHWNILISTTGTATTAATISSTTFTGMAWPAAIPSTCQAATESVGQLQNGYVLNSTIFAPTWAATGNRVVLTGTMRV